MQHVESRFGILRGEKAIDALYGFIDEVEEERGKELTKKQTKALVKLAKMLISSIEAEVRSDTSTERMHLLGRLKKTTTNWISSFDRVRDAYTCLYTRVYCQPIVDRMMEEAGVKLE